MINFISIIMLVSFSAFASTDKKVLEARLDQHFSKILHFELKPIAGEIVFGVRVKTSINKQLFEDGVAGSAENVRLPLGSTNLLFQEIAENPDSSNEFSDFLHPDYYRSMISSIDVQLDWGEVSDVKTDEWLKQKIIAALRLDELTAFEVKILPIPILKKSNPNEKRSWLEGQLSFFKDLSPHESAAVIGGVFIGIFFLTHLVISSLFQGNILSSFRGTLSEGFNKLGQSPAPNDLRPLPGVNISSAIEAPKKSSPLARDEAWEHVKLQELIAFSYDSLEHPLYESAAVLLVHNLLPQEKADQLKDHLPDFFFDVDGPGRILSPATEINDVFFKLRMEYALILDKPLALALLPHSGERCLNFLHELMKKKKILEAIAIVNRLTPLKREWIIEKLSFEEKLNMTSLSHKRMDVSVLDGVEKELVSILQKTPSTLKSEHALEFPLEWVTNELLRSHSFDEDEELYKRLREKKKQIPTPLMALELWDEHRWQSIPLNEIALVFFGYSDEMRQVVTSKFESKRLEWLENFMSKYRQSYLWNSPEVQVIRKRWMEMISLDLKTLSEDNDTNEDIPPSRNAA